VAQPSGADHAEQGEAERPLPPTRRRGA
jgi:hypothetical protein